MIWIALGLLLWTGASIVWFLMMLPYKNLPGKWYDVLFFPPVAFIAVLIGLFSRGR